MKVLWITNTLFPAVCDELGLPVPHVGGWMFSGAKFLLQKFENISLGVASLYNGEKPKDFEIGGINYFVLPGAGMKEQYNNNLENQWKIVKQKFKPDVVHIHGSEYPHGVAYLNGCGNKNAVLSIQGLVSIYERHYFGGIPKSTLLRNVTPRDIIRKDTIFGQHRNMQNRAVFEREILKKLDHIIGRTSWDKSHAWAINPVAKYHFCNETLRPEFYKHNWKYDQCEKYSIFLSQAHYPIKGLQQMLRAMPLILREYPQTKLYVAGSDFFSGIKSWKINGFGKYIRQLIKKFNLKNKIVFTGVLSEQEMCTRYLKSNVFVCPSSIENSPNSVGEAQLLGVPSISAYVGGVSDMVEHEKTGLLYRFEETEMLAESVVTIFNDPKFAGQLSVNGQTAAKQRHSRNSNAAALYSIYNEICKS